MVVEQIEEILANLLRAELGRRSVEVLGVALHGVDIRVDGVSERLRNCNSSIICLRRGVIPTNSFRSLVYPIA